MAIDNKDKKVLNVPHLRFPEFSGEWKKHSLGEIGETIIGLTYKPSDVVDNNGIIVFRSSNIKNGMIDYSDLVRVNKHIKDKIITKENDILVCARNGSQRLIGKNAIIKQEDANNTFGAFMMVYRANDNPFILPLLSTKKYFSQVGENLGARINQITTSDFNGFEFYFPENHAERTKIAELFRLLDERIATQNKIIDKLQSLIKGIAQNITCSNKPNVHISECLECSSSTLQESDVCENGAYPVYGANGVVGYLNYYNTLSEAIYIIKDGSGVGTVSYVTGKCSPTGTLNILQVKDGYSLRYLYYLLKVFNFEPYKTGMAIPHIYFKDYGKAKIFCPQYSEQLKYATLLFTIDDKLSTEQEILKSLNLEKQYLLRQMFI
ncbi:restriction endonuclease subunit S [Parabacteroides distasonis]|uniref:restriction endonuclease subunit S n=1 Tax=Parabacteroides distasonis TaxID=823 RepID=UPI001C38C351|nr:restriction endonuclease subunit S [Parabacteroides distasonis]MBV4387268.1 restriction endonuclease subunit S [Parabacteroides distasonis]